MIVKIECIKKNHCEYDLLIGGVKELQFNSIKYASETRNHKQIAIDWLTTILKNETHSDDKYRKINSEYKITFDSDKWY